MADAEAASTMDGSPNTDTHTRSQQIFNHQTETANITLMKTKYTVYTENVADLLKA